MDIKEIGQYNILSLAYLGDSIWESHIRKHYFMANLKVEDFKNKVKDLVNAKAQSKIYKELLDSLDEELKNICKRGRNANIKSFAKSCSQTEYRNATAFEVLIAVLHLTDNEEKIDEIIKNIVEGESTK